MERTTKLYELSDTSASAYGDERSDALPGHSTHEFAQKVPEGAQELPETDSLRSISRSAPSYTEKTAVLDHSSGPKVPATQGSDGLISYDESFGIGYGVNVKDDGRIDVDIHSKLVSTLAYWYPNRLQQGTDDRTHVPPHDTKSDFKPDDATRLNIVIQVVGSRGDVQPFVALGTELQQYGHRIRIATHNVFEGFVRDAGLEFYPIGGDPTELMAYMVKNPGLIPNMKSLQAGEIERKQMMVLTMLEGFWESCVRPDMSTGRPFVADAIIANPPSFAHVHCAQALGVPVHIMFTMPWSSTTAFPHPLVNLKGADVEEGMMNYFSYGVVEWLTWQGLGHMINRWRRSIDLEDVLMFDGPMLVDTLKVPHTYCWSPALVPKPGDWPTHIDVCGFFFRDPPIYEPPAELSAFLASGPKPVYIGFGSIVLDDPESMSAIILEAVRVAGVRAIISKGWSNLTGAPSDQIYYIGDCPHEWLFQHVAAVVHHGGAGTTACGLKYGVPTTIIPFFGDQPFWGHMVAKAGAGPSPIHHTMLTATNLSSAIRYCLSENAIAAAQTLANGLQTESGVTAAAQSFHRHLPKTEMQCDLLPEHPAVWVYKRKGKRLRLSKIAAHVLVTHEEIQTKHLSTYESKPVTIEATRRDPVSGGASAVMATAVDMTGSITGMVTKPIEEYRVEKHRREFKKKLDDSGSGSASLNVPASATSEQSERVSVRSVTEPESSLSGKMAAASAKSIAGIFPTALKGMTVNIPLAITEGLKSVPGHYNGDIRSHGPVTDMRSGAVVAGKTFAWGMIDGVSDLFVQPYKGARKEGAIGALKGVGKGVTSLTAKSGAGMFGLFAYNSQGIAKSLHTAFHGKTRKVIHEERLKEGDWLCQAVSAADKEAVVVAFKEWSSRI